MCKHFFWQVFSVPDPMCDMMTEIDKERDMCEAQIENKTIGMLIVVFICVFIVLAALSLSQTNSINHQLADDQSDHGKQYNCVLDEVWFILIYIYWEVNCISFHQGAKSRGACGKFAPQTELFLVVNWGAGVYWGALTQFCILGSNTLWRVIVIHWIQNAVCNEGRELFH